MATQKTEKTEQAGKTQKIDVKTPAGKTEGSVELPAELFDAPANIALMHQVVAGPNGPRPGRAHTRPRPAARFAAVAGSPTGRRAPVMPDRARRALRSSPAVVSCAGPTPRESTAGALQRR